MTITKADLVDLVAENVGIPGKTADEIVQVVFDGIIAALHRDEKVELRGFGSFRTRHREERTGRNPKTGDPVVVPAKRVPFFKPGKHLRDELLLL